MKFAMCMSLILGLPLHSLAREAKAPLGNIYENRPAVHQQKAQESKPDPMSPASDPASNGKVSYEDLPRLVKNRNENLKASQASLEAQKERTGHLARSFLPHLTASLGEESFRTDTQSSNTKTNWKVGASVNIYRGGRDHLDEKIREGMVEIARTDFVREQNQELKRARIAYWDLLALEKLIAFRKEELKRNDENLQAARRRAGAGVSTNADSVQLELHSSTLAQGIKQLELRKDVSRNRLAAALGLDEHENIVLTDDFPNTSVLQSLAALKIEGQIDVQALKARENVESLRSAQAGRWWRPQLDVYASYGVPSLDDEFTRALNQEKETAVGVRLSFDLGQGASDHREANARALEAESMRLRGAYKAREALAVDHDFRHDLRLGLEILSEIDKNIEKAREFLKLTQSEYNRGLKNGPDLLAAFRQLFELQERSVELRRDLFSTKAELESLAASEEAR